MEAKAAIAANIYNKRQSLVSIFCMTDLQLLSWINDRRSVATAQCGIMSLKVIFGTDFGLCHVICLVGNVYIGGFFVGE